MHARVVCQRQVIIYEHAYGSRSRSRSERKAAAACRFPTGRRRARLTERADALFAETEERLLAFDMKAADRYGDLVAARHAGGKPISVADAIIASITWVHRATLATRNTSDFGDCEIHVVNPL
jgi:toxin FitB